ncbi:MAG: efflux RND transporter periplasmic adaptor subunit [candidate division Zixibacteria bacterium]
MRKPILHTVLYAILVAMAMSPVVFSQMPPTLVSTQPVSMSSFHDQINLIGRTEAKINSRVVSEVSGRIVSINAREGNAIKSGDALVTVDSSLTYYAFKAKDAQTRQAKGLARLAESNLRRIRELADQKLVSSSTIDSAEVWSITSTARFDELDAERAQLARDLVNCVIKAPFDGFTLRKLINVGEWAKPGTPVYQMVQISAVAVIVDLPERYFGQLEIGAEAAITSSSDSMHPFVGRVTGIARSAVPETHTFPVIIGVANKDFRLGGGALVRTSLNLKRTFESLTVPKDAIIRNGSQTMVYTIADGKAAPIPVTIKSTKGDLVAVDGMGLTEGMEVVVRGNERIFPGAPVMTGEGAASMAAPEGSDDDRGEEAK